MRVELAPEPCDQPLRLSLRQEKDSYVLIVSTGNLEQVLREAPAYDQDGPPLLLWAGDLDKDGKLDLLMDITNHYNISETALFLSSLARSGELVGKAGTFRTGGC